MLGEFFGVTAVTSALLEMNRNNVFRLSSVMNNSLDVFRLVRFKTELLYITDFIDNQVEIEYASPEIRKLKRQISLIKNNDVSTLNRTFKRDISGMSESDKEDLVSSIEKEILDIVKQSRIKTSVVNNFRRFDSGEVVSLGEYDLMVLLNYKKYYRSILDEYLKLIKFNSFKEITVFGEKLHRVWSLGPGFLLGVVERMFSVPGANRNHIRDLCLESVQVIRAHYPSDGNKGGSKAVDVESIMSAIDFRRYLASSMGIHYDKVDPSQIPSKIHELGDKFDESSAEFMEIMHHILSKGLLTVDTADELIKLYFSLFRLDNDLEYLCEQLFPEGSNIVLEKEELQGIFDRLSSVGFYLFSFNNTNLMTENLKKLSFSSESRTVIDPDFEKRDLTFRQVVDDIESFCLSMIPAGTPLEGANV